MVLLAGDMLQMLNRGKEVEEGWRWGREGGGGGVEVGKGRRWRRGGGGEGGF